MKKDKSNTFYLKGIRFSLGLKLVIVLWSFYVALQSEELPVSITYLVVSIVFAGLFIIQLQYYRKKAREQKEEEERDKL